MECWDLSWPLQECSSLAFKNSSNRYDGLANIHDGVSSTLSRVVDRHSPEKQRGLYPIIYYPRPRTRWIYCLDSLRVPPPTRLILSFHDPLACSTFAPTGTPGSFATVGGRPRRCGTSFLISSFPELPGDWRIIQRCCHVQRKRGSRKKISYCLGG